MVAAHKRIHNLMCVTSWTMCPGLVLAEAHGSFGEMLTGAWPPHCALCTPFLDTQLNRDQHCRGAHTRLQAPPDRLRASAPR